MKCSYCGRIIPDGRRTCSDCGHHVSVNTKFSIGKLNYILIATAALQLLIFIVFIICLMNGIIAKRYIAQHRYEEVAILLSKYERLANNEEISAELNDLIINLKQDYDDEKISYSWFKGKINQFSSLSNGKYQIMISEIMQDAEKTNNERNEIAKGDNALSKQEYDNAISIYKNVIEKYDYDAQESKKLIDSVLDIVETHFYNMKEQGNIDIAFEELDKIISDSKNEELKIYAAGLKKEYIEDIVQNLSNNYNNFIGPDSAYDYALEYGGDYTKQLIVNIDQSYQAYIQKLIDENKTDEVIKILTKDMDNLKVASENINTYPYIEKLVQVLCDSKECFFGSNSAYHYAIKYGGDSLGQLMTKIDLAYQTYIQKMIDEGKYKEVIKKISNDMNDINASSEYINVNTYNEYRVACDAKLLESALNENIYIGYDGAITIAKEMKSFREDSVNVDDVINKYIYTQREHFKNWVSSNRSENGTNELIYDSGLESASKTIIDRIIYDNLPKEDVQSVIDDLDIGYKQVYSVWLKNVYDIETIEKAIAKDYSKRFLYEEFEAFGIGINFNEDDETISGYVMIAK